MPARRLAISVALLISIMPASQALAGQRMTGAPDHEVPTGPLTRQDVLAGRASGDQVVQLLQAQIEAAGGDAVEVASEEEALGGYAYPILALDLDGDGDDETLLEQHAGRTYIVALDDGSILWRERGPKQSYVIGAIPGDLFSDGGQEVVLAVYRWKTGKLLLAGAGASGVRWVAGFDAYSTSLGGLVQADGDDEDELAVSTWSESTGELTINTFDGETGFQLSSLRSTPSRLLNRNMGSEGFVTDGPDGSADEAVFVTPLPAGVYAERLSLSDGTQAAFELVADEESHTLSQGPDFTGDGKRDGYITEFLWNVDGSISTVTGVFDAATLSTAWTQTSESSEFNFPYPPYQAGDANGDGGQDLCTFLHEDEYDPETDTFLGSSSAFTCYSGATGVQLWTASRSVTSPPDGWAHTYGWASSDLDGDGVIDPILEQESGICVEEGEYYSCEYGYSATAHSGTDGSPLWSIDDPDMYYIGYDLTDSNLDGAAGHDGLETIYEGGEGTGTRFSVFNGLSLTPSWEGVVDTGAGDGYVDGAIEADLDGDGSGEVLVTADAYVGIGEPTCEVYFGEEYCWYEDYEEHAYAAAFEPGGELLWQVEL